MMNEWINIPGTNGLYQINKDQKVRSIGRMIKHRNGKMYFREGRIRKPVLNNHGYYTISISLDGRVKITTLHRLMAKTFIENSDNLPCINHKNGIKTDNGVENLEWCTSADNNRHAWATGLNKPMLGEKHHLFGKKGPNAGKYGEQLKQTKIIVDLQTGVFYYGARDAAEAKSINLNNLKGMLAGFIKNTTSLKYA